MRQHKQIYPASVHIAADGMSLHDVERLTMTLYTDCGIPEDRMQALASVYKEERRRFLDESFRFGKSELRSLRNLENMYREAFLRMEEKGHRLFEQQRTQSVNGFAVEVRISVSLSIDTHADDWTDGADGDGQGLLGVLCSGWPDSGIRCGIGGMMLRTDADGNEQLDKMNSGIIETSLAMEDSGENAMTDTAQAAARFETTLRPMRDMGLAWQDLLMVKGFRTTAEIEYLNA